jgi:hypothetical protein
VEDTKVDLIENACKDVNGSGSLEGSGSELNAIAYYSLGYKRILQEQDNYEEMNT